MTARSRSILISAGLLAAVGVGVGGAPAIGLVSGTPAADSPEAAHFAWDGRPPRFGADVADPHGSNRWVVRLTDSKDGSFCAEAGRARGRDASRIDPASSPQEDFGRVEADGSFTALPVDPNGVGACSTTPDAPFTFAVDHHPSRGDESATAVIFGAVKSDALSVTVGTKTATYAVPVTRGSFLLTVPDDDLAGGTAVLKLANGLAKTYALHTAKELSSGLGAPSSP
jgi:hypothetical protein